MKNLRKIFFYYCAAFALFLTLSGLLSAKNPGQLLPQLVFLPITIYFAWAILLQIRNSESDKSIGGYFSNKFSKKQKRELIVIILIFLTLITISTVNIYNKPSQSAIKFQQENLK